jgi:hypothetical protein
MSVFKEVNSPVNTRNTTSKLKSNLPLSPGARSDPSKRGDSVPAQPQHSQVSRHSEEPASIQITGPEE